MPLRNVPDARDPKHRRLRYLSLLQMYSIAISNVETNLLVDGRMLPVM